MASKMLIDAAHPEETRVVVVRGNRIEEFDYESSHRKQLKGNIYLAKVTRVEPSLQAAFVDYGGNRHGFLAFSEIHPDYYQIPIADRQALIEEEQAEARRSEEEFDRSQRGGGRPQRKRAAAQETPDGEESVGDARETEQAGSEEVAPEQPVAEQAGEGDIEAIEEEVENRSVDQVGAEDALEEVPERRRHPRRTYKIQEVIKRRQIMLVQVVKEERGNKGAALTTYLSLAGRYCVLMPNTARGGGISRKITDAADRKRLKELARDVEVPEGMGLIIRTAGAQRTKAEIKRDFDYLMRLWESVRDLTLQSTAPSLVYEEGSLIKRAIRDLYTKDVDEIMVEGEAGYREAKEFMKMLMPSHARNVKPHKDTRPLFSRYKIDSQLDGLFSPVVTLQSGGYIVMNQTEALVSIDINSGKATREHNIEDTAVKTNLEAAEEIARQLRLRDLAGLIVIDFIDMDEKRNNRAVERRLKEALKHDRARIQVGRISHFGLLEMSRQRLRQGMLEGSTRPCPHCEGTGLVRSVSSCALSVLRGMEEQLISRKPENLTVYCHPEVAAYILNDKRDHLLSIEQSYGVSIFVVQRDSVLPSESEIERGAERPGLPRRAAVQEISAQPEPDRLEEEPAEVEAEFVEEKAEEAETNGAEDDRRPGETAEQATRRRRRRGRRGGRRGREREVTGKDGEAQAPGPAAAEGETEPAAAVEEAESRPAEPESEGPVALAELAAAPEAQKPPRRPRRGKPRREPVEAVAPEAGEAELPDSAAPQSLSAEQSREPEERVSGERIAWADEEAQSEAAREQPSNGSESWERAPEPARGRESDSEAKPEAPERSMDEPRRWQPPAPTPKPSGPARTGWWRRRGGEDDELSSG